MPSHCRRTLLVLIIYLFAMLSGCSTFNHQDDYWLGEDKLKHFAASAAIAAASTQIAKNQDKEKCNAALIGFSLSLGVGTAKEAKDMWIDHRYFSGKDMVANTLGAIAGSLAVSGCGP